MTEPTLEQNTIERCAGAIAEVRDRYRIVFHAHCFFVEDTSSKDDPFFGSELACQAWIDREAACACIRAMLPVGVL